MNIERREREGQGEKVRLGQVISIYKRMVPSAHLAGLPGSHEKDTTTLQFD